MRLSWQGKDQNAHSRVDKTAPTRANGGGGKSTLGGEGRGGEENLKMVFRVAGKHFQQFNFDKSVRPHKLNYHHDIEQMYRFDMAETVFI